MDAEIESQIEIIGDCWVWRGGTARSGTPVWRGRSPGRQLFEETLGRPALIRNLVNLCGNRLCVAPNHRADTVDDIIEARTARSPSGCLEWQGLRVKGYGWFRLSGRFIRPHRWVWERDYGEIPEGLVVDHICNNPSCCEVSHLRCVTQGENGRAPHSNSPAGVNLRKTHCKSGHEFTEDNTYHRPSGGRACRACMTRWSNENNRRRRNN